MTNEGPGKVGLTFTSCLSVADSCGHSANDEWEEGSNLDFIGYPSTVDSTMKGRN
jgi:hypothetical protein